MVLTRSARRAAQMLNGTDPLHGTGDDAPAAYAAEPGEECAPTPLAEGRRPMLRKTSSLQRITETVTLIRSESWRHLETQVELIASGVCLLAPRIPAAWGSLLTPSPTRHQASTLLTFSSRSSSPYPPSSIWCDARTS